MTLNYIALRILREGPPDEETTNISNETQLVMPLIQRLQYSLRRTKYHWANKLISIQNYE